MLLTLLGKCAQIVRMLPGHVATGEEAPLQNGVVKREAIARLQTTARVYRRAVVRRVAFTVSVRVF